MNIFSQIQRIRKNSWKILQNIKIQESKFNSLSNLHIKIASLYILLMRKKIKLQFQTNWISILLSADNILIIAKDNDDQLKQKDDFIQKLEQNDRETANNFQNLCNYPDANTYSENRKFVNRQQIEKKKQICQTTNNEQENFEKSQERRINNLNFTIYELQQEIFKIEKDDTENQLNEKLIHLQQQKISISTLTQEILGLPIMEQIEYAENNLIYLNKAERKELKKNQNNLVHQISNLLSSRKSKYFSLVNQNDEFVKNEERLKKQIIMVQKKNQIQIEKYKKLIVQNQQLLKECENTQFSLKKTNNTNKELLEKQLDQQMKQELKAKKQKGIKLKEKLINLENTNNQFENENQSIDFDNSFFEID
ncbi:unnamed protein product (macronuclear) [Paramecium tetraurelia]|uniref:Uncharacterized protein n=1 Tax=Paramecium tetraurelia TaxID=5888 RepID=A0CRL8_PARTE|nr:uncharacterized protein GSPATT00009750001 [Paramecium tetraurelia]CAK73435.1 unnamed protein product [Paramecium tetraurelia]|eukprot:XP_001440832.1 hypothetical protein (macronuclear) [Paramecium tetraurelia strain d4-2]